MDKVILNLTVIFEEPFWIGIYEREVDDSYEVCKIIFGAEPKDYEVYDFMNENWGKLRFSPYMTAEMSVEKRINPKRMQRAIKKKLQDTGIGTKAQQALKLQQEQSKLEKKTRTKKYLEMEEVRRFELQQEKRKAKHRGH